MQSSALEDFERRGIKVGICGEGGRRARALTLVLPHEVVTVRSEAYNALEKAFDRSETDTVADWLIRCLLDLAQLWRYEDLWAITQVIRGKRGLYLQIVGIAGKYEPAFLTAIEAWGRSIGCERVYGTGRKGWLRRLADYKVASVTLVKKL